MGLVSVEDSKVQSQIIALLVPQGSHRATLLVRRGDGQFALEVLTEPLATHANPFLPFIPIRNAMFIAVLQVPSRVMVSEVCASPETPKIETK